MAYPPDEDKRYFYDGAAYAMAWGHLKSTTPGPKHLTEEQREKRRKKNRLKRQRRNEKRNAEQAANG